VGRDDDVVAEHRTVQDRAVRSDPNVVANANTLRGCSLVADVDTERVEHIAVARNHDERATDNPISARASGPRPVRKLGAA
jgi:hypothetical protein